MSETPVVYPNLISDEIQAMSRKDLERYADRVESQLNACIHLAEFWRGTNQRLIDKGYIAPFRYTPEEMAESIRQAIFWADWPSTEHRDIFAVSPVGGS